MPYHLWPSEAKSSRREFLATLVVGGAALAYRQTGRDSRAVDSSTDGWFALISDTHIAADPKAKLFGQVMADNLRLVVADILSAETRPTGALIDGDLAFKAGTEEDYSTLLGLVEPLRAAGIPVHFTLGNHDNRDVFRRALGSVLPSGKPVEARQVDAFETLGHRFVLLDSLDKTDQTPGELGEAQLTWLRRELDSHTDRPTLVFVHHHPRMDHIKGLVDHEALLGILQSRPWVKALVFGHTHHWRLSRAGDLRLVNLPPVGYPFAPNQPIGYCRFMLEEGKTRFVLRSLGEGRTGADVVWHTSTGSTGRGPNVGRPRVAWPVRQVSEPAR